MSPFKSVFSHHKFVAQFFFDEKHLLLWCFCSAPLDIIGENYYDSFVLCHFPVDVMNVSVGGKISAIMASHADYPDLIPVLEKVSPPVSPMI